MILHSSKKGFTVIELMVSIIIFTMGFMGAYLLVDSASSASIRSQDQIIGANLMREQIELIKNIRDTNWMRLRSWDSIKDASGNVGITGTGLTDNTYYTIENNFTTPNALATIVKLPRALDTKNSITSEFNATNSLIRLSLDAQKRYTHNGGGSMTNYATFFKVEPLVTKDTRGGSNSPVPVPGAHKIQVYFVSFNKGYRIYNMSTIITDWKAQ